jgi:hypothetical protein
MIELCPAGRGGTPVEVATVGALLMRPEGASITGSTSSSTAELPRPTSTANSPLVRRNLRGSATNRVDRVTVRLGEVVCLGPLPAWLSPCRV